MITSSDPVDDAAQGCCSIELSISNSTTDETDVDSDEELFYPATQVEMSLHFSTLLSARLTWDSRVKVNTFLTERLLYRDLQHVISFTMLCSAERIFTY